MLAKPSIRIILVKKKTPLTKKYSKKNPLELYFIQSKKHVHHTYSSNPVVLKDIHIYMYLFCGRPCRRPVDGADVNFFIGVSYGHDCFTEAKNEAKRAFQIP